jgi:hypothetical protein
LGEIRNPNSLMQTATHGHTKTKTMHDPNADGKATARRKPINQMQTATHGTAIEKTKKIPNQYPHGMVMNKGKERNARSKSTHGIAMGSPCVGPQERPKGESSQDPGISNAERNPTRYGLCT